MIKLIDFQDLNFFHDNPDFLKKINDNRYNETNFSIVKRISDWVIYVIDDENGVFETFAYNTKQSAIDSIESGKLKKEIFEQKILYDRLAEVL